MHPIPIHSLPIRERAQGFLTCVLLPLLLAACGDGSKPSSVSDRSFSSPIQALSTRHDSRDFERAEAPRQFVFPDDHGPHPDFQTEWWYITGNLKTASGRRFGIQWTIFRRALAAESERVRASTWASRQLYMGHMAVSDLDGGRQLSAERFARGAAGLAGAELNPFHVWLEDWSAVSESEQDIWPLQLKSQAQTENGNFKVDLRLEAGKPMVLQGDRGLSWKHEGGASYYYSYPRLPVHGKIWLDGETFTVSGEGWLDREWSTSTLSPDQTGWDWFSLQLADDHELMVYQLRRSDGSAHPMSAGAFIAPDGSKENLSANQIQLEVLEHWKSPRSGAQYPSRWRLRVPEHQIDLEVIPLLADQELDITFRYWEGAVEVRDRSDSHRDGRGYVELVGYDPIAP